MIAEIEDFKTGWYGLFLRFDPDEIDRLILSLQLVKNGKIGHFHLLDDHASEKSGIADIEISLKGKDELDNMRIP